MTMAIMQIEKTKLPSFPQHLSPRTNGAPLPVIDEPKLVCNLFDTGNFYSLPLLNREVNILVFNVFQNSLDLLRN